MTVAGTPPFATPATAAGPAPTYRCPSCGNALLRHGAFYWHATPRARCPITAWSASTIEAAAPPAHDASVAMPASVPEGVALPGAPTKPPGPGPAAAAAGPAVPNLPMNRTTQTGQGATMSKRGGNKPKRVSKPPMPNKGPKAK